MGTGPPSKESALQRKTWTGSCNPLGWTLLRSGEYRPPHRSCRGRLRAGVIHHYPFHRFRVGRRRIRLLTPALKRSFLSLVRVRMRHSTWILRRVGRRRVTLIALSTFPSAPLRTGRAAFTASGSLVSMWVMSWRSVLCHHVVWTMGLGVRSPVICGL